MQVREWKEELCIAVLASRSLQYISVDLAIVIISLALSHFFIVNNNENKQYNLQDRQKWMKTTNKKKSGLLKMIYANKYPLHPLIAPPYLFQLTIFL